MRVHHIINSVSLKAGGAERLVRSLNTGLKTKEIESYLVSLVASDADDPCEARSLGLVSPYDWRAVLRLRTYARKMVWPGDIIHAHLFPTSLFVAFLKKAWPGDPPLLLTEHSTFNRRRGRAVGFLIDRYLYRRFDHVCAISEATEAALTEWRPDLKTRTSVVTNGSRPLFASPIHREATATPIILSVGRLQPHKNFDTALSALALLEDVPFEYWIAGEGTHRDTLEKMAQDLGLAPKVRFLGHVQDVKSILEKADIFLMPSRWEGFGLAAIEAMNASLPIIASDVPGLREVVGPVGEAALTVDPDRADAIAAALRKLLTAPEERARLGQKGFKRSLSFGEDQMVDSYIDLYQEILRAKANAKI